MTSSFKDSGERKEYVERFEQMLNENQYYFPGPANEKEKGIQDNHPGTYNL